MKTAILLPVSVLCVLAAFAQPAFRTEMAIAGNAPAMVLVGEIARQVETGASLQLQAQVTSAAEAVAAIHGGRCDGGLLAAAPDAEFAAGVQAEELGVGGLVFVVHPLRTIDNLTATQLAGVLTGSISNWSQLGGPDAEINVLRSAPELEAVCDTYLHIAAEDHVLGRPGNSDRGVERQVAIDPFAIGMMSLAAAERAVATKSPLKILRLDGQRATEALVRDRQWPLLQSLFLLLPESPHAALLRLREHFHGADGHRALLAQGFEPRVRD